MPFAVVLCIVCAFRFYCSQVSSNDHSDQLTRVLQVCLAMFGSWETVEDDVEFSEAQMPASDEDEGAAAQPANAHDHISEGHGSGASDDAPAAQGNKLISVPPATAKEAAVQFDEETRNNLDIETADARTLEEKQEELTKIVKDLDLAKHSCNDSTQKYDMAEASRGGMGLNPQADMIEEEITVCSRIYIYIYVFFLFLFFLFPLRPPFAFPRTYASVCLIERV